MPKLFSIRLDVEEIALGGVLRRLNDIVGVARIHLDLDRGGEGAGRKELEKAAVEKGNDTGTNRQAAVVKFLMQGPKHIREITALLGGKATRAYGVMTGLRKQGLSEPGEGSGMHQLTQRAKAQLGAVPALPAPATVKRGPGGRAAQGSGPIILRTALDAGPLSATDVYNKLVAGGMSRKGVSGVLVRARRDGLIKKNGQGYELTAKGQKIEMGAQAHG